MSFSGATRFHGRGIGRSLIAHALPLLGPDAFVVSSRPRAVSLYRSFGFEVAARFPGEAYGFSLTCVRLCLPGSAHRHRPPRPTPSALELAGFTGKSPGRPVRGDDGVWHWL